MSNAFLRYHSGLSKRQKTQLSKAGSRRFLPPEYHDSHEIFEIVLSTEVYAPNHIVTVRTDVDGWERDIHGGYYGGAWYFGMPKGEYDHGVRIRFYLDGTPMKGRPFFVSGKQIARQNFKADFSEKRVRFARVPRRHRLPYDGLRVREDAAQQSLVRNCYHESREFDVIVIGSGMGGGILADALTDRDPALNTLVLDIGCLDFPTHVYNVPGDAAALDGKHQVHGYMKPDTIRFGGGLHMNLGGRSVFWSGVIPRMLDWELSHWPRKIADHLRKGGYAKAEKLMRKEAKVSPYQAKLIAALQREFKGVFEVESIPRSYHQPEFESSRFQPRSFINQSTGTFSTSELLLDSLSYRGNGGAPHLHVNLNHMVTDLRREGNRIVEVVCQDLVGNKRRTYRARQYVLAAGSMESVRIALQSGLDRDHPLIGKGYTDHPAYFIGYDDDKQIALKSQWAGPGRHAKIFFYPATEKGYQGVFFNTEILINGQYWRERHADDEVLEDRTKNVETTVRLKFSFDASLNEENHIRLDRSGGSDGRGRKLDVMVQRVAENPKARETIEHLSKRLVRILGGPRNLDVWKHGGWGADGTPAHAGGSMRMGIGNDSRDCVVDTDLKFLNIDNLYLCDVSVFPRIPAANPSLTLAALALRLSDHLARQIRKRSRAKRP